MPETNRLSQRFSPLEDPRLARRQRPSLLAILIVALDGARRCAAAVAQGKAPCIWSAPGRSATGSCSANFAPRRKATNRAERDSQRAEPLPAGQRRRVLANHRRARAAAPAASSPSTRWAGPRYPRALGHRKLPALGARRRPEGGPVPRMHRPRRDQPCPQSPAPGHHQKTRSAHQTKNRHLGSPLPPQAAFNLMRLPWRHFPHGNHAAPRRQFDERTGFDLEITPSPVLGIPALTLPAHFHAIRR